MKEPYYQAHPRDLEIHFPSWLDTAVKLAIWFGVGYVLGHVILALPFPQEGTMDRLDIVILTFAIGAAILVATALVDLFTRRR